MFNDYPVREYIQVNGNDRHLVIIDEDIVYSLQKYRGYPSDNNIA